VKYGDSLSSLIYNFALEYDGRKIHEYKKRLELNTALQLLTHDDVNLSGDNINIIKRK
jgi:hypothetical protein